MWHDMPVMLIWQINNYYVKIDKVYFIYVVTF